MEQEMKALARSILALARDLNVRDALALAQPDPALEQALAAAGGLLTTPAEAKACVACASDPPDWALKKRLPILCAERNGTHKDYVLRLLQQDTTVLNSGRVYTGAALEARMNAAGYKADRNRDLYGETDIAPGLPRRAPGDAVYQYLDWYKKTTDADCNALWLVRSFVSDETLSVSGGTDSADTARPFLSVLTRTQGRREAGLTEVLLCLAAQTDRDFELMIVGHRLDDEGRALVERLIAETPAYLRQRIRLIACEEEGRTAPLNCGFAHARGEYVAVLDDDDIVLDNWVESFHKLAREHYGSVLHTYMMRQDWEYIPSARGQGQDLRASGGFESMYCRPFDLKSQLVVNHCPQGCVAFPSYVYQRWGLRFDPTLNVTEDWDFMMRTILLTGVSEDPSVTCIYRWWTNGTTSATLHSQKEWDETYLKLTKKFSQIPVPMPASALFGMGTGVMANVVAELFSRNGGTEFDGATCRQCESSKPGMRREFDFKDLPEGLYQGLLRFDPCYPGGMVLSDLCITVTDQNEVKHVFGTSDVSHNGWWISNSLAFMEEDPQIYFLLPDGVWAKKIHVEFNGPQNLPVDIARSIADAFGCTSAQLRVDAMHYSGPVPAHVVCGGNQVRLSYDLSAFGPVKALDLCACRRGSVIVQDFCSTAEDAAGQVQELNWKHNGVPRPHAGIFLRQPHYTAGCDRSLKALSIEFRIDGEISAGAALSIQNPFRYALKKLLRRPF